MIKLESEDMTKEEFIYLWAPDKKRNKNLNKEFCKDLDDLIEYTRIGALSNSFADKLEERERCIKIIEGGSHFSFTHHMLEDFVKRIRSGE